MTLTADRLRKVLDYNPFTGEFRWKVTLNNRGAAGTEAGNRRPNGYRRISIDGTLYYAQRLAWLYVHGVWPIDKVDHRNQDKEDNRVANLREATDAQNRQNESQLPKHNTSGYRGVTRRDNRWSAKIKVDGKQRRLGWFDTPEEAHAAYLAAKAELHPFWT